MKILKYLTTFFIIFIFFKTAISEEVTVIELHNQSIDQILNKKLNNNNTIEKSNNDGIISSENNSENEDVSISNIDNDEDINNSEIIEDNDEVDLNEDEDSTESIVVEDVSNSLEMWGKINKEDLLFLLKNINNVNSKALKKSLIGNLNIDNSINQEFNKDDHNKLIIDTLLKLGNKQKSYELIQSFDLSNNKKYINFYREFELNYLLSTYNLDRACEFRNEIKDSNLQSNSNFFLKVDIFCLALEEKFDEANLLNSLLIETQEKNDEYFQYLYNSLQTLSSSEESITNVFNEENIFLYSAMHRIGNIPLNEKFLKTDPLNLAMPIILSSSTDMKLRIKSAHLGFFNNLLNSDSLSALYQGVDFTYDELNDPINMVKKFNNDAEIGMAYFYQLINIQLLPKDRLDAILEFWKFAENNNLELIAYELALKNLNTIEPAEDFIQYGPEIAKAYIYNENFERADKWLVFAGEFEDDMNFRYELYSSKLLYNLFSSLESENFLNILFDTLENMKEDIVELENNEYKNQNEILNIIFSTLHNDKINLFKIKPQIEDSRSMPSIYITNLIRNSISEKNSPQLLLSIIASINEKKWNEIHPEHLSLILIGLNEYDKGLILNEVLLEILKQSNII